MNNEAKTTRQCIKDSTLPDEVKQAALVACDRFPYYPDLRFPIIDLVNAMRVAFHWSDTPEGADYWRLIIDFIDKGGDPANAPLPPLRLPEIPWEFVNPIYKYHAFDSDGCGFFYSSLPYSVNTIFRYDGDEVWQSSGLFLKTSRWHETVQGRDHKTKK